MKELSDVYVLCNARWHDTDFARLKLLELLQAHEEANTWVGNDYGDIDRIEACKLLITYTCDVVPPLAAQRRLRAWVEGGGRWFALHGTNAVIEFVGPPVETGGMRIPGKADTPDKAPELMELLGSRFIAHPPSDVIRVRVADPTHPVVAGMSDFEIFDEPYYCEFSSSVRVLLDAHYTTPAASYVRSSWDEDVPRPQMYEHRVGDGAVLYLTLGHCRGKYDMRPHVDEVPVDHRAWEQPVFLELLNRGIEWGLGKR